LINTIAIGKELQMIKKLAFVLLFVMSSLSSAQTDPIITDSTSRSTVNSTSSSVNETTVKSPPPSAISPSFNVLNNDLCTVGVSGAVQTQILGISGGTMVRDMNCERIKLAKNLYDMGMKVAAVATLCQDDRVFTAMMNAGTPCPVDGKIGEEAKRIWDNNPERKPEPIKENNNASFWQKVSAGLGVLAILLILL
jgi:hypothetical protein